METALKEAMTIDGALGVCLVDWDSGMSLGALGGGKYLDLDVAAAGNTEVIWAKMRTMESLRLDDSIEDILVTLGKQYRLIRLLKKLARRAGPVHVPGTRTAEGQPGAGTAQSQAYRERPLGLTALAGGP